MNVLVTGLNGFTGKYLEKELTDAGHNVAGLDCDINDISAIRERVGSVNPEAVVHLAGIAFVGHGDINDIYDVNLKGTRNLLQVLAENADNVKSVLLASSANVYGNSEIGKITEDVIPSPMNDYAVSKLSMEYMAKLWMDKLPIFLVRPFNYTGVGQSPNFLIPKIVSHFHDKKPIIELGNMDVWREFGDVRTVAKTYRLLLEKAPRGETFNVCTGVPYSLREVIGMCEDITGHTIQTQVNPDFVRENEVKELSGSGEKLRATIGDIKSGELEETLRWMLQ
jgi:nucleoside-diphosphate-sugar epimerase